MNFGKKKPENIPSIPGIKKEYKNVTSSLIIYNQAPDGKIDFDEFASLALERFSSFYLYANPLI